MNLVHRSAKMLMDRYQNAAFSEALQRANSEDHSRSRVGKAFWLRVAEAIRENAELESCNNLIPG